MVTYEKEKTSRSEGTQSMNGFNTYVLKIVLKISVILSENLSLL